MNFPQYGIIPAGGLGTRFLPASGAVPKELFPIFDTPLIAFSIEEMAQAGVKTIFIVVNPWKRPLFERYLGIADELESRLVAQGKTEQLQKLKQMKGWPKIVLVDQPKPQGLAQAIDLCRPYLGNEAFYVLLPDEVLLAQELGQGPGKGFDDDSKKDSNKDLGNDINQDRLPLKALGEAYIKTGQSCVGLFEVRKDEVSNYGVAALGESAFADQIKKDLDLEIFGLKSLVEKPKTEEAPSCMMLPGRYLLTSQFWSALEKDLKGLADLKAFGEIHMTDALDTMANNQQLMGVVLNHDRYDVGRPQGYMDLSISYAKQRGETWLV